MANALETLRRMSRRDEGIYQKPDSTLVQQITQPIQTVDRLGPNNPVRMMNLPQQNDPTSDSFFFFFFLILRDRKFSISFMLTSVFVTMT